MIYRAARLDDAKHLGWTAFQFDLTSPSHRVLVVEDDGEVVAYAVVYDRPTRVSLLEVRPDRRREGVGRALVEYALDGASEATALCVCGDEPAAFWRACGFEYVGDDADMVRRSGAS